VQLLNIISNRHCDIEFEEFVGVLKENEFVWRESVTEWCDEQDKLAVFRECFRFMCSDSQVIGNSEIRKVKELLRSNFAESQTIPKATVGLLDFAALAQTSAANSFSSQQYRIIILREPTTLYRVGGERVDSAAQFFTRTVPDTLLNAYATFAIAADDWDIPGATLSQDLPLITLYIIE
jgi:hypothetical protein